MKPNKYIHIKPLEGPLKHPVDIVGKVNEIIYHINSGHISICPHCKTNAVLFNQYPNPLIYTCENCNEDSMFGLVKFKVA